MVRYKITLTEEERKDLKSITSKGTHRSQKVLNALILLNGDEGDFQTKKSTNEQVAGVLKISMKKIDRVKKRFVEEGLDIALGGHKGKRVYEKKADGDFEAHLVALSCSEPPEGFARWSLRMLADRVIELNYIDCISYETVRRVLKKNEIKPWKRQGWVIPPDQNSSFVANMEKVLDVYKRPYHPQFPVVCMDESSMQLIGEVREPIPAAPGHPVLIDDEYVRNGVASIFIEVEPVGGKREVKITEQRTRIDWAHFIKEMLEERYVDAEKVVLVMDNLNTHDTASLYTAFPPEEARRLAERLEIHYTPKHGSWLNIAEIELSVLKRQCLAGRIGCIKKMRSEVAAWNADRNNRQTKVDWQFRTKDARIKLKRLYPKF